MAHVHAHNHQGKKTILTAFLLNLVFAVFEFFGGLFTGSVAVLSDAIHDLGDALSIGVSFWCEKKSHKAPDEAYTFGYARYSVLGAMFTTLVLILGSGIMAYHSILRLHTPAPLHHNGMILIAVIGFFVNLLAAYSTHKGHSLNERAVTLHLLEDVFGWASVLVFSVIIRITGWNILDPILSLFLCAFILYHAIKMLREALEIFLEKAPHGVKVQEIKEALCRLEGVRDIHHVHLWTLSGQECCVTLHAVCTTPMQDTKRRIKEALCSLNVCHSTVEIEEADEHCLQHDCAVSPSGKHAHE